MTRRRSDGKEHQPWWARFMLRHSEPIEVLLFGVVFLGLGSILTLLWAFGLVYAVIHHEGQLFAEALFGTWIPLGPWAGLKWLRERRSRG
jgi:hypothetical protein